MNSLLHALNIGTLATWLSFAGLGTVGIALPLQHRLPEMAVEAKTETLLEAYDLSFGDPSPQDSALPEGDGAAPVVEPEPPDAVEPSELPPELPELAELAPLPEIPDLPPPPKPVAAAPSSRATTSASRPAATVPRSSGASSSRPATSGVRGSSTSSTSGGQSGGSGMSTASRLAAGRMPAPSYPSSARRQGQTGTVLVEFTIDTNGRVISAVAKSPSQWPLLNDEAVRTVRRWKFPPGPVMKLQRPIIFQLR